MSAQSFERARTHRVRLEKGEKMFRCLNTMLDIEELKKALEYVDTHPDELHTEELAFFKDWLIARGCTLPISDDDEEDEPPPDIEGADEAVALARSVNSDVEQLKHYSRAIELNPSSSRHFAERGEVYFKSGNYERAKADADAALKIKSDSVKGLRLRANVAWMQNEVKHAYFTMCEAQRIDYSDEYDTLHRQMKNAFEKETPSKPDPAASSTSNMPLPSDPIPLPGGIDMNAFMQSSAVQEMASNLMNNPALMQQMMGAFQPPKP